MKKILIGFIAIGLLTFVGCKKDEVNTSAKSTNTTPISTGVAIGDSAYGGIVAYILQSGDAGYDANVQHGLIAAPSDQGTAIWGCYGTLISGADGIEIGAGNQNTADILAGCSETNIAAYLCDTLTLGGYSDWFLPSYGELNTLVRNIGQGNVLDYNIGGFDDSYYWSSTEMNNYDAFPQLFYFDYQYLSDTYLTNNSKLEAYNVRAVRTF